MPVWILLPLAMAAAGCAHKPKELPSAKAHFEKALEQKKKERYPQALETLRELRKLFVYSPFAGKALLLAADIHFAMEDFPQALKSLRSFRALYPSKKTAYALFRMGLAAARQLPSRPDLDISIGDEAIEHFQALLDLGAAAAPYKKQAEAEIKRILDLKAAKEFETAAFYRRRGWEEAALQRFRLLIKAYPESPLLPKALLHGLQLARALEEPAAPFKEMLLKNFPSSKEARSI